MRSFPFSLLLPILSLPFLLSGTTPEAPFAHALTPEVVGPSVLLNAQNQGRYRIIDLRTQGRAVPRATRRTGRATGPVFVLGEPEKAKRWLRVNQVSADFVIPPRLIEFEPLPDVPQIAPRRAKQRMQRDGWPLFDISEAPEFASRRLPGSQRFDYVGFQYGEWKSLPRHAPFIVACRVGHRSQLVVRELRKHGYKAYNLTGGLWQWECDGLEVEQ